MKHKLDIIVDLPEDNDIHHFIKRVEQVGETLDANKLSIKIAYTFRKEDINAQSFMKAIVSELISNQEYAEARREYYDERDRDVSIDDEEMFIYIREDYEKVLISCGDWATIADDEFYEILQNLIKQNIHLFGEDIPSKLKKIELEMEYTPPLVGEEVDEDDYVDVSDGGKRYISIGMISEEWLNV